MIYQALVLLIPASVANSVPPIAAKLFPSWNYPIDFYLTFKGKRIFGAHKTVRGFVFGVICAHFVFLLTNNWGWYESLFGGAVSLPWHFGLITGAAALVGDALKSFFKRQLKIKPGRPWIPFDQTDWVICYLLVLPFYLKINFVIVAASLLVGFIAQIIAKIVGYKAGINDTDL